MFQKFVPWFGDLDELIGFLAERRTGHRTAIVAPCDGVIEEITESPPPGRHRWIALRGSDGRLHRLRASRFEYLPIHVGDAVRAGDALVGGMRNHRALLHAWGPVRIAAHLLDELELETARRGLRIPRSYWALTVRAMLGGGPVAKATTLYPLR